jgi:DNA-binding Xre family transcriptional regulator
MISKAVRGEKYAHTIFLLQVLIYCDSLSELGKYRLKTSFFDAFSKIIRKYAVLLPINSLNLHKTQLKVSMGKDINRLKVVLAEKKRTNKWLAEQLGKDPATVSKWCTNTAQPGLETLLQIAKVLEVDVKELLNSSKEDVKYVRIIDK